MKAAEALERLEHGDKAADIWLGIAQDTHIKLAYRREAAQKLEQLGNVDAAAEFWLMLLRDVQVDPGTWQTAVVNLERLGYMEPLLAATIDTRVSLDACHVIAEALERMNLVDRAITIWLSLAGDSSNDRRTRSMAARNLGRLAGNLSPEQGAQTLHLITRLDKRKGSEADILQHFAWGLQTAQWSNPESATWLLPLIERLVGSQTALSAVRDVAWEALLQLASLVEEIEPTTEGL